jgi:hypothetical protein
MSNLTLEEIEEALNQIFKDDPIPRFHPSAEKKVDEYLKEHLDDFYFMDYSSMTGFVNIDNLKKVLNEL